MDNKAVVEILKAVASGKLGVDKAVARLSACYEGLDFANLDIGRGLRTGISEVLFCEGKTRKQVVSISKSIVRRTGRLLATRADAGVFEAVKVAVPKAVYNEAAGVITVNPHRRKIRRRIAVVSGGTSDIPVAEEAAATAEFLGTMGFEKGTMTQEEFLPSLLSWDAGSADLFITAVNITPQKQKR